MPDVVPGVGAYVDPSTTYCNLTDLKAELAITDTADDDKLNAAIAAASREVDRYCGRRFWADSTAQDRYYWPESSTVCEVDDISSTTGLVVAVDLIGYGNYTTTLTLNTDFILDPINAAQQVPVFPYTEMRIVPFAANFFPCSARPGVKVTAKFGWAAVPDDVDKATCLQAAQLFKAKDAVFGVAAFGELGPLRVRSALNPIAEGLLAPYAKPAVG